MRCRAGFLLGSIAAVALIIACGEQGDPAEPFANPAPGGPPISRAIDAGGDVGTDAGRDGSGDASKDASDAAPREELDSGVTD